MRMLLAIMAMALALGQAAAPAGGGPGSISGRVLTKDGYVAANAVVRVVPEGATATADGRNRVPATARTDAKGYFTLANLPAGAMNLVVTWTAADGTLQRGQLLMPTQVKAGEETKLAEDVRLVEAPMKLPANSGATTPPPGRGRGRG